MLATVAAVFIFFVKFNVISADCEKTYIVTCDSFSDVIWNTTKHTWTELLVQPPKYADFPKYDTLDENILDPSFVKLEKLIVQTQLNKLNSTAFTYLTGLRYLILYDNDLDVIEKNTFYNFIHAEKIGLIKNNINHIESQAFYKSKIDEINFSENNLRKLHKKTFVECIIAKLVLNHNDLEEIYEGSLPKSLKVLNLNFNGFWTIPKDISNLKNLQEFTISHNTISKISATDLDGLSELNTLDVSFNKIESTGNTFDHLKNLKHLDLAHNEILEFTFTPALTQTVRTRNFMLLLAHNKLQDLNLPEIDSYFLLGLTLSLNPWNCKSIAAIDVKLHKDETVYYRTTCDEKIYSSGKVPCCVVPDAGESRLSYKRFRDFRNHTEKIDCDVFEDLSQSIF